MKRLLLTLVLCLLTSVAAGQPARYVHNFEDHKVYIHVGHTEDVSWVRTIRWAEHQCKRVLVSPVDYEKNGKIVFPGGTVWKVEHTGEGLRVHIPKMEEKGGKTPIHYKESEKTLSDLCAKKEGI
jgi:hypothetical protein